MSLTENQLIDSMKDRHTAILGMTRSGKTYFVKYALDRLNRTQNVHTLLIDPKWMVGEECGAVCKTPMEVYERLLAKEPRIVFYPRTDKEGRIEDLNKVIDLVFNLKKREGYKRIRRVVAVDEVQTFVRKGVHDGIDKLYLVGAGVGITGICMTQRLQNMNETVWSQSENKVIFRIDDRLDYLKSRNLLHYIEQMKFFKDEHHNYWYYATKGNGLWSRMKPVGQHKPKKKRPLTLNRWPSS